MFSNIHNWRALLGVVGAFDDPVGVLRAVLARKPLQKVTVRTPTGPCVIQLRNFESLKTAFSIFCRHDYPVAGDQSHHFLDIGANIGVAATYFLTRNTSNSVTCFEPDSKNLTFLRRNMAQHGARARVVEKAVGTQAGGGTLFRSEDGKYTSLLAHNAVVGTEAVEIGSFVDIIEAALAEVPNDIIVKLDIEGLETALIASVDFKRYPRVSRIIVESLECAALIGRAHERRVRNGYIEDIRFM
jgi:FkbM family methyltransferase